MRPHHTDPTLEVRHLVQNRGVSFDIKFSRAIISDLIQKLNLITLRKATFIGTILPINDGDWILSGRLGASVDQACSLTLVPVRTRIELPVIRNFRKSFLELPETELETLSLNEDNDEQLDQVINILSIFCEVLSLNLPDYPQAENAVAAIAEYGPPGSAALTDDYAKPFAILAKLRDKLK